MTVASDGGVAVARRASRTAPRADGALTRPCLLSHPVHHNYDALLDYNCSHSYAVSVGVLAGRLTAVTRLHNDVRRKPGASSKKRSPRGGVR